MQEISCESFEESLRRNDDLPAQATLLTLLRLTAPSQEGESLVNKKKKSV